MERRNLLRNGEKYLSALAGADYCLSGDDEGGGAVGGFATGRGGALRRSAPWAVRWRNCANGWKRLAVKSMTSLRRSGTSGRNSTSPRRSWTRWRAGRTCCTG